MTTSFEQQVDRLHELQRNNARILIAELGGSMIAAAREYDARNDFRWNRASGSNYSNHFREAIPVAAFSTASGNNDPSGHSVEDKTFNIETYSVTSLQPNGSGISRVCCLSTLHLPVLSEVVEWPLGKEWEGDEADRKVYDVYDPFGYGFPAEVGELVREQLKTLDALRDDEVLPDLDCTRTAILRPDLPQ